MKIKLKSILTSALFQSLFDLEPAIEIRQVHKRFITLSITLLFWHNDESYHLFRFNFVPSFGKGQILSQKTL